MEPVFRVESRVENHCVFLLHEPKTFALSCIFFDAKNPQTRTNTRKARNHKGCGLPSILVGVGGLEPARFAVKTA